MAVIETDGVVKRYETEGETVVALDGVDFTVETGDFVAVMGPSGSGKSTLLNLLGLLDVPTEGTVCLDGTPVSTLSERERTASRKRTIGFIFQNFYLISTLTALENVEIPRLLDREAEAPKRAASLLARVGLGHRLTHRPSALSGGQKQRVAIARALINEPRVILADEPTGNLDRSTGRTILEQFSQFREEGVAVVAVTHDPVVAEFAERTVNLIDGRIVEDGIGGSSSE
ncbi:MAG: ABC transporter ATP-binding protein [Halodesulfurarchaeum sp.]